MTAPRRSWWGWGWEDQALTREQLSNLSAAVAARLGVDDLEPASPAPLGDLDLRPPRIGPSPSLAAPRLAVDLHPSVAFSEEYSDNFQISSTNKIDNFRTIISPGLLVGINGPRTLGTVSAIW